MSAMEITVKLDAAELLQLLRLVAQILGNKPRGHESEPAAGLVLQPQGSGLEVASQPQ